MKILRRISWVAATVGLALTAFSFPQSEPETRNVSVNGNAGEASTVTINGHTFIDVESLIRLGSGSLRFHGNEIMLDFCGEAKAEPGAPQEKASENQAPSGFSMDFMKLSIENISEMREWATAMSGVVQEGRYLDAKSVAELRDHAATGLQLATAAATTEDDGHALDLLRAEFDSVAGWSERLLAESKNFDTAKYSVAPGTLRADPQSQKILACGRFLSTMLASGKFSDDPSCH